VLLALKAFIAPVIVACAMFMESVDANVIVTALPEMARAFGRDPVTLKIAVTSYVLGLGVFIPVCGWLADRYGAGYSVRRSVSSWWDRWRARRRHRSACSPWRASFRASAAR
jgi:MFS family permease